MNRLLAALGAFVIASAALAQVAPDFSQYPVKIISEAKVAAIDLSASPQARAFKTSARQTIGRKANFAGHYVLITQGCGAPCIAIALVDVQTERSIQQVSQQALAYHSK